MPIRRKVTKRIHDDTREWFLRNYYVSKIEIDDNYLITIDGNTSANKVTQLASLITAYLKLLEKSGRLTR